MNNDLAKQLVYFDYNTFIYLKKTVPVEKIKLLTKKYQFVYSPAHIEELANSVRGENFRITEKLKNDFKYLSILTNDREFLPSIDKGIVLWREPPIFCYRRVVNDFYATEISEKLEENFMSCREEIKRTEKLYVKGSSIKGILDSEKASKMLKTNEWFDSYLSIKDKRKFWDQYKEDYRFIFTSIPGLFNVLNLLDNSPEPTRKYRSHMHDTTHALYATQSNYFISDDKRLFDNVTEVFRFIGIPTTILKLRDFLHISDIII